ncbi:hypothetical protein F5146DRAFT_1201318 [Armillaria mellea]|nr:hypothetical protein F5146DRAFT_1201318 [Armillaria mellea]
MVQGTRVIVIINWECAGWFPAHIEYCMVMNWQNWKLVHELWRSILETSVHVGNTRSKLTLSKKQIRKPVGPDPICDDSFFFVLESGSRWKLPMSCPLERPSVSERERSDMLFSRFEPQSPSSEFVPVRFESAITPEVGQKDSTGIQAELKEWHSQPSQLCCHWTATSVLHPSQPYHKVWSFVDIIMAVKQKGHVNLLLYLVLKCFGLSKIIDQARARFIPSVAWTRLNLRRLLMLTKNVPPVNTRIP